MRYDLSRWDTKSLFSVVEENPIAPRVGKDSLWSNLHHYTLAQSLLYCSSRGEHLLQLSGG